MQPLFARIRDSRIAGYGNELFTGFTHCSNFQPPGVERTPYSSAGSSPPPPGLTSAHQLDRPLRRPLSAPILHGGAIRGRAIQQARRHRSEQLEGRGALRALEREYTNDTIQIKRPVVPNALHLRRQLL